MDVAITDGVAMLTMDDGKVNAMDRLFLAALEEALDACHEAAAVVLRGREGTFSAGLDVQILERLGPDDLADLLCTFGRTMLRVWEEPRPVVGAVTGHAVAGGTILAMTCDHAVAAGGDFRWGLTETAMGFPIANWMIAIARCNVSADRLDDLVLPGRVVDAAAAVEVGFADEVVPPMRVVETAVHRAQELATLPHRAYAYTKHVLRGDVARRARASLEADVRAVVAAR
jgi:enoyl-CoA hydratase